MGRPVTLFTGQWADLDFDTICQKAKSFGYDGIELACWGDHFEVNRALLSHQNEENTLLIFYAQHSNIAPFNFAVKTYFAHKERDLDQLFHNYKSSKNMRILLLSDGMTELRDEKWEHWQRLIHSQEKWTHVRFKTKHYKLSFIDTKATFLSDD